MGSLLGISCVHKELNKGVDRAIERLGKVSVTGRYHRPPKKISDDYELDARSLGSGYNGSVFLAYNKDKTRQFAVKSFKLHGVTAEKKQDLVAECEIFLSVDHPHICRLCDVYETREELHLVMECMEGGEVLKRVQKKKHFSEKAAAQAAYQMLLALNYIHTHHICHRDIKLENFLYSEIGSDHLKLIDFGFGKIWDHNPKMSLMSLSCGTLAYVAPEVLNSSYTCKCDLWSLGVVVFILLLGHMPFGGREDFQIQAIRAGQFKRPASWQRLSMKAREFISKLLVVDPNQRLSAEEALKDEWILAKHQHSHESFDEETIHALTCFAQASIFRRACMTAMAWSLTNKERAQVRQAFLEMDTEQRGVITLHDFKKVMEDRCHINDEEVLAAFHALDASHHDEIHYSDFLAAMVSSRIRMHDVLLAQAFKRFDTDNTGYVTKDNLKDILGESFEGQDVQEMFEEADFNHNGEISYQEFLHYLKNGDAPEAHAEAVQQVIDNEFEKSRLTRPISLKTNGCERKKILVSL